MALAISNVTGTVSNGESITITGTDFGATGPSVLLFDDFESGTNGAEIPTGSGSAVIGQWYDGSIAHPLGHYSTSVKRGNCAYGLDFSNDSTYECITALLPDISDILLCYWVNITSVPSDGNGPNFKMSWVLDNNEYLVGGSDHTIPTTITALNITELFVGSDDSQMWDYSSGSWECPSWATNVWRRFCCHIHGHASTGSIKMWETTPSGTSLVLNQGSIATLRSGSDWEMLTLPGYARTDASAAAYYDDMYVAYGTGACARVEIGNNATYTSCTNLAVCTPTAWGDTEITATVRAGSFTTGTAYLFVVDASGNASAGTEITFGEGSSSKRTLFRK